MKPVRLSVNYFWRSCVVAAVSLLSFDDDSGVCDGELSAVGIVQWARQAMTVTMVMECGVMVVMQL